MWSYPVREVKIKHLQGHSTLCLVNVHGYNFENGNNTVKTKLFHY